MRYEIRYRFNQTTSIVEVEAPDPDTAVLRAGILLARQGIGEPVYFIDLNTID